MNKFSNWFKAGFAFGLGMSIISFVEITVIMFMFATMVK